jgi:hypothetical protein
MAGYRREGHGGEEKQQAAHKGPVSPGDTATQIPHGIKRTTAKKQTDDRQHEPAEGVDAYPAIRCSQWLPGADGKEGQRQMRRCAKRQQQRPETVRRQTKGKNRATERQKEKKCKEIIFHIILLMR